MTRLDRLRSAAETALGYHADCVVASLVRPPLFARLEPCQRILLAGAGGGYDVFAATPLYFALRELGKEVFLANLSFTYFGGTDCAERSPGLFEVTIESRGEDRYFPERALVEFLATRDIETSIFGLEKRGVVPTLASYRWLVRRSAIDAIVLVDGGTDILMRGDEAGLGTPAEDMTSLAAVGQLDGLTRVVCCLGFGIDAFHGVCHAHFLENTAALAARGGFLGAVSLTNEMPEAQAFIQAVELAHQRMPGRQSIVNGSIASAIEGRFGDFHRSDRTSGSQLFINPLMSMYWSYDLTAVVERSLYLSSLLRTETIFDVQLVIEAFRKSTKARPRQIIPV
ncbi:MAG: DUF1152 domain-containing protein [Deltaproteobacteria bacterium]|nr:DUF1152 domain-containing protein [Deltaproteobacteria bacterium]